MQNEIQSNILNTESKTVHNAIIQLGDTDDTGKGRHFKSRFIQPGVAGYPGQFGNVLITKESLDKFINTMVGVPVIVNHKDLTSDNVDDERVGVVNSVWYDEKDGWYWCDGIIWDETAQELITDKNWSVSCSYDVKTADNEGGSENNIKYDMEFLDGVFTHLALVNNPRYERANIVLNSKDTLTEQFADIFFEALAEVIVENSLGESVNNDRWITIHPHGDDSEDYRRLKLEDGETPKEAIDRVYKKEDNIKDDNPKEVLKANKEKIEKLEKAIEILRDKIQDTNYTLGERKGFQQEVQQKRNELQQYKKQNAKIEWQEKKKKWDGKIAGVKKGAPMSFPQADNLAPNPKYEKGTIYSDNCQTCVVAFELRQRGYDVEARGLDTPEAESIMAYANTAWIDPNTGYAPNYIKDESIKDNKALYNWLQNTLEEGKRYTLQWGWKGKKIEGHIVSIFKKNNSLVMYDPQDGDIKTDKEILKYAKDFKYERSVYRTKLPDPPKLLEVSSYDINFEKVDKILLKAS